MWFFTKQKPILSRLIPEGYVDIHSHLLPGIDDGCASWEETQMRCAELKALGIHHFTATPHIMAGVWHNNRATIEPLAQSFSDHIALDSGSLHWAAEYMLDSEFTQKLQEGPLCTLKENLVLVEMSYQQPPLALYDWLFELQVEGYRPVLAHPERYNFYHGKMEEYRRLKKAGCLFQLNLPALTGYYGWPVLKTAALLLNEGLYDYSGTDVHHEKHVQALNQPLAVKNEKAVEELLQKNVDFYTK